MFSHYAADWLMVIIFLSGYFLITIEHYTKINKATVALLMAIGCWTVQFVNISSLREENLFSLGEHLKNISQVIFFLLGALAIVETINVHKGFRVLSDLIGVSSKRTLLWTLGILTFFLSAILDNLTTTIVMISLVQKLIPKGEDRLLIGGGIVIAANAGGAWTPIGDVTTTMLWIGGQISTLEVMKSLWWPSVVATFISFLWLSFFLKGKFEAIEMNREDSVREPYGSRVFILGISLLLFVPFFKMLTGLPPFMGVLLGLGLLWLITDILHRKYSDRDHLLFPQILSRIDLPSTLFFLGILLSVDALETAGILKAFGNYLNDTLSSLNVIAVVLGVASAVIDNVPLVAAAISMYDLAQIPQDHSFWQLTAFTAGTGGSMLIIGSAAGVVFMGLEKVDFLWYFKKITVPAALGFFSGIAIYLIQQIL